jgi:hypothetical protein
MKSGGHGKRSRIDNRSTPVFILSKIHHLRCSNPLLNAVLKQLECILTTWISRDPAYLHVPLLGTCDVPGVAQNQCFFLGGHKSKFWAEYSNTSSTPWNGEWKYRLRFVIILYSLCVTISHSGFSKRPTNKPCFGLLGHTLYCRTARLACFSLRDNWPWRSLRLRALVKAPQRVIP